MYWCYRYLFLLVHVVDELGGTKLPICLYLSLLQERFEVTVKGQSWVTCTFLMASKTARCGERDVEGENGHIF